MEQAVYKAICTLISGGKNPSLALVKSRLGGKVPMPVIIKVFSQYKTDPEQFENTSSAPPEVETPQTEQTPLTEQLNRIEAKLDLILNALAAKQSD